jgi:putative transposase
MAYKTDLNDAKWDLIKKDFEPACKRENGHKHDKKSIVNTILYIVKDGIQWWLMPNDLPRGKPYTIILARGTICGVWGKCLGRLTGYHRQKAGRASHPSYSIIEAQSVKTQYASEERGIDGGNKVKGHKRHVVVDILGTNSMSKSMPLIWVTPKAHARLWKGPSINILHFKLSPVMQAIAVQRLTLLLKPGLTLYISEKIEGKWAILPKRWLVARTFSWLDNFRRLSKDFEMLPATAENNTCKIRLIFCQTASVFAMNLSGIQSVTTYYDVDRAEYSWFWRTINEHE